MTLKRFPLDAVITAAAYAVAYRLDGDAYVPAVTLRGSREAFSPKRPHGPPPPTDQQLRDVVSAYRTAEAEGTSTTEAVKKRFRVENAQAADCSASLASEWGSRGPWRARLLMTEAASVVTALAALGALYLAWRTVQEARTARREDEQDRRLRRLETIAVLLEDFAHKLDFGNIVEARTTQARLRALVAIGLSDLLPTAVGDLANLAITTDNFGQLSADARSAVEEIATGVEDLARR